MQQLMGSVMMLVGVCAFLYGLIIPRWQVSRTASWPSVTGTVTRSSVEKSARNNYTADTSMTFYGAAIKYQYQVAERRYRNDRVHAGGSLATSMPSHAREQARRYPEGADVEVYYNPDKPSESCLEKSEQISLLSMGIGALFVIAGFMF